MFAVNVLLFLACKAARMVVDLAHGSIPGAPSYVTIENYFAGWTDAFKEGFALHPTRPLMIAADNVANYNEAQSRIQSETVLRPILCHAMAVEVINEDVSDIQKQAKFSPACWERQWHQTPSDVFTLEEIARDDEKLSEKDMFDMQRDAYIIESFQDLGGEFTDGRYADQVTRSYPRDTVSGDAAGAEATGAAGAEATGAAGAEAAGAEAAGAGAEALGAGEMVSTEDGKTLPARDVKICPDCSTIWSAQKRSCSMCGTRLPSIAMLRKDADRAASEVRHAVFRKNAPPRYFNTGNVKFDWIDDEGVSRTIKLGEGGGEELQRVDCDARVPLETNVEAMPILDVDPKGYANLKFLTIQFAELARLRGFAPDDDPDLREWFVYIRDQGATEDVALQVPNILSLCGRGHEEMCYHHVCCALAYYSCAQDFFDLLHFVSDSAGQLLASGAKSHKAWQFLQISRRVVTRAVCREYMVSHHELRAVPKTRAELSGFYEWLRAHTVGVSCQEHPPHPPPPSRFEKICLPTLHESTHFFRITSRPRGAPLPGCVVRTCYGYVWTCPSILRRG